MAWEHINLVRQVPLQYVAKLILFALASRVDDEGKCWPSIDTICRDTGLKHRTTPVATQNPPVMAASKSPI